MSFMNISILKMSLYVETLLKNARAGLIHSVYQKTINLSLDGALAALQVKESPMSPISLITDLSSADISKLKLNPGERVCLSKTGILLNSSGQIHTVSYAGAEKHDLFLSAGPHSFPCKKLIGNIKAALAASDTGGFDIIFNGCPEERLSLMLLAAKKRIAQSYSLCRSERYDEAGSCLSGLLGLGIGLTPSGDDFLCGVLAGLRLLGEEKSEFGQALRNSITEHLADTIDISAAFLSCALCNQYSLAVNSLLTVPEPETLAASFSKIGHSSGTDTLCGVLFALALSPFLPAV